MKVHEKDVCGRDAGFWGGVARSDSERVHEASEGVSVPACACVK